MRQEKYKEDLGQTIERMKAFWEKEIIDRVCLAVPVTEGGGYQYRPYANPGDDLEKYYFDPVDITERARKRFEKTVFMGDSLPGIFPYFGTGAQSLYLGGAFHMLPETIWFEHCLEDLGQELPPFSKENVYYRKHIELLRELVRLSENEYFIGNSDNTGVLDAVVNLRGNENLLFDLIEDGDAVKKLCKRMSQVLREMFMEHAAILKKNNLGGMTHSWMHLFAPGTLHQLQCDFSVMISPEMFREFVLPELHETCEYSDYTVYHMDGQEQVRHLDAILSIEKLNAIQWVSVAGQPDASEFIPVFQKIQKAGKNLVLRPKAREVDRLTRELSSRGLHIVISDAASLEEAETLLAIAARNTHE